MKTKKAFTLVELIIVIAIIAILAVTAFLLLTKWLAKARDSSRIADITTIDKALNLHTLENTTFPKPDNVKIVYNDSGVVLWYQGEFGQGVASALGNMSSNDIQDPNGGYYKYSVASDNTTYQLSALKENETSYNNTVNALDGYVKIEGHYNEYFVVSTGGQTGLWHIPSIFTNGQVITGNIANSIYEDNKPIDNMFVVKTVSLSGLTENTQTILSGVIDVFSGEGIVSQDIAQSIVKNAVGGINVASPAIAQEAEEPQVQTGFISLVAGNYHTCGISSTGGTFCWGDNGNGQLGDGTATQSLLPKFISLDFTSLSLGYSHSCGISSTGGTFCWGRNSNGQVGDGSTTLSLLPKFISSGFTSLSLGSSHSCGISITGGTFCWGRNGYGQLGDGTATQSLLPKFISSDFASLSLGGNHSCGISITGSTFCWGQNSYGQLGDGTTTQSLLPKFVSSNFTSLSLGLYHSCGISNTGGTFCWGRNSYGQLGDGSTTLSLLPKFISSGFISLSLGGNHSCGISSTGGTFCWGRNNYGQLGNGTTANTSVPVQVKTE